MTYSSRTAPKSIQNRQTARQARLTRTSVENAHRRAGIALPRQATVDADGTSISTVTLQVETSSKSSSAQEPPTYDEIYPPRPDPVSQSLVKAHSSPPQGMDPLVAAMWHNENLSALHSLPNHLLVKIIRMLSNSGIECLRRSARRFPPLCVKEVLSPQRSNDPKFCERGPLNWPTFGAYSSPPPPRPSLLDLINPFNRLSCGASSTAPPEPHFLELLDRDQYCSGCQAARRSPRWEQRLLELTKYIHCSTCGADHPTCLFSAKQRLMPARIRHCIAHQGFMRVCEHEEGAISLSRLRGLASERDHPTRQPWQRRNPDWQKVLCTDKSHIVPCAYTPGGPFSESGNTCGSRLGLCVTYNQPMILGSEESSNCTWYHLGWTAHVPYHGQMSTLRSRLEETYEDAGKYIIPYSAKIRETPALRCFDPNDCHCAHFAGSEKVRWEWERGPWLPGPTKCMSDPYKCLDTMQPPKAPESTTDKIMRRLKKQPPSACAADQKRHQSREEYVPFNRGVGYTAVDVRPCHTSKDCLKVDYIRQFWSHHEGKITPQWYNALDPGSYNLTEDEDGLGVFWCRTDGCRNYFKGVPNYAGILRRRDFHRECRDNNCR